MVNYRECAGIILFNDEGRVLMGARADQKGMQWQFPQGGIENGESPADAALRELKEETSVTSAEIIMSLAEPLTYTFPKQIREHLMSTKRSVYSGQRMHWFLMNFKGTEDEINLQTQTPEFKAYEWANIKKAHKRIVYFKRDVYKKACRVFAPFIEAYIHRAECLVDNEDTED